MLRDVLSGLVVAAVTGVLFALVMYFCPVSWNLGDDAWNLLVLVGIMLSGSGFFAEFLGSRLNRGLREASAEIDQRSRRFEESIRARALRLNTYALAPLGCPAATNESLNRVSKVSLFPGKASISQRPAIAHLGGAV